MASGTFRLRERVPASLKARVRNAQGRWGRKTAGIRMLPDFLIIGAQRCGTTSLFKYLVEHPGVAAPPLGKGAHFFDTNFDRGENWYRGHFPVRRLPVESGPLGRKLTGEGSPYYLFHPLVPARVAEVLPQVKLIVMLRDPVVRAHSHYWHELARGFESVSFAQAIALEPERLATAQRRICDEPQHHSFVHQHWSYVSRGLYAEQLEAWYSHFSRDQLLVISSERFFADPDPAYAEVLSFLGLAQHTLPRYETFNPHAYPDMAAEMWRHLEDLFAAPNAHLWQMLGTDFGWSS